MVRENTVEKPIYNIYSIYNIYNNYYIVGNRPTF